MNITRVILLTVLLGCGSAWAGELHYYVVLGSYSTDVRARNAATSYNQSFNHLVDQSLIVVSSDGDKPVYRLVAGPFNSHRAATDEKQQWRSAGVDSAWVLAADIPPTTGVRPSSDAQPVETSTAFKDVLGNETLRKRGIPGDLTRGAMPRVNRELMQRFQEKQQQPPGSLLPPASITPGNRVSQLSRIHVKEIRLSGSDLLADELGNLFATAEGRTITIEELLALKNQANQIFIANGYVNSGVVVPDQQVEDGVIHFDVIEGEVESVEVTGDFRPTYVEGRLDTGAPFNLQNLQQSLKLLEKNPMIERVNARIVPGREIGIANLDISVDGAKRFRTGLIASNNRAPAVGAEYGEIYFAADNLTRFGDTIRIGAAITEGMDSHSFSYSIPFTSRDFRLVLDYSNSDSSVVEEPFDDIDIESLTESVKAGFVLPLYKTPTSELAIELFAEKRRNLTSIFGVPFSFTHGAVNGESRVAPVRLGVSYIRQGSAQSFAGRLVVSKGTGSFDATENETAPDGDFVSALAQLQYSRQITDNFHITGRLLAQYADDPLLAVERIAIGGLSTVRGYRENQIVRDNAYLATIEGIYRIPANWLSLELITFVDWGSGKNHKDADSTKRDSLVSAGIGMRMRAFNGLSANIYLAHGFDDVTVKGHDLQDDGIHFRLNYEFRF